MALTNTQLVANNNTAVFSSSGQNAITTIIFCNTDPVNNGTISLYAVAYPNIVGTSTTILSNLSLPATETFTLDTEKLILGDRDVLYASSNIGTVGVTVSSVGL
jgi:hypothetical protein